MTRRRKLALMIVFVPLPLLALLVAALLVPAVQTFAAQKALAGQGGVERVAVGFSGATITGFKVEQPGLSISSPSLEVNAPLLDLVRGRIDLRSIIARDIVVDFDPSVAAKAPPDDKPSEPRKPFAGVLGSVNTPNGFRIQFVDISGMVRIAGPRPLTARFAVSGGGVAAGETGKIALRIDADAGAAGSVVSTFELSPGLDAAGQLSSLALALTTAAEGGALKMPASLNASLSVIRDGGGELYRLNLAADSKSLAEIDTRWAPGAEQFPGTWKISVADTDFKPFLPPFLALPTVRVDGSGEIMLSAANSMRASGRITLLADALERLGLPELGVINVATRFDIEGSTEEQRVNALELTLASGDSPVMAVESLQAFSYDNASGKLSSAKPDADLVAIRLLGVPAGWWQDYAPDLTVSGAITAALVARPAGEGFVIESREPLRVAGVNYAGLAAFEELGLNNIRVERNPGGLSASVGALRVVAGGVDLIGGRFSAAQKNGDPLTAEAAFTFDLAKLADQPALRGKTRIAAGRATLALDTTLADEVRAALSLQLTGLRAAGVAGMLPSVDLKADLARDAAGVVTLKLPLTASSSGVTPARSSDLEIDATLAPGASDWNLIAMLSSRVLHVPDLQAFAALAADSAPAAPVATPTPAPAPSGPLWAGITGHMDFDLARVIYGPGIEFPNTRGSVRLTPAALSLNDIQTMLSPGGALDLSGALRWIAPTKSYVLAAELVGRDVAMGPLLKALNPSAAPALEGTYAVVGAIAGQGSDPATAISAASVDLRLNGRQGVLRAINLDTNRYARAGNVVSGLAGLAGALSGNAQIAERANQISALNNIARRLGNLAYDELVVEARRGPDGAVEIAELRLTGADVLLAGSGAIRSLPGRSFLQQPLALALDLGTRGDFARDLATLRVLKPVDADADATVDANAFRTLTQPLTFDGTLQNVGTAQVMRVLTQALGL